MNEINKFEIRINNIGIKYLQERYEILQYFPNELYNKQSEFVKVNNDFYKSNIDSCVSIHSSCFEKLENSLLIAHFNIGKEDCQLEWCSDRPLQLNVDDFKDFMNVVKCGYEIINSMIN